MKNNILIVGCCGSGKTWIMLKLIELYGCDIKKNEGLVRYQTNKNNSINIVGNYLEGEIFQGSDKLAMNVMRDTPTFVQSNSSKINIFEGDRFTSGSFISKCDPIVLRINDNGLKGLKKRKSSQSERQLKSIRTRVSNIDADLEFENSSQVLEKIIKIIESKCI